MATGAATSNATLLTKVTQIETLLAHCSQTLTSLVVANDSTLPPENSLNPLHVLRDTAKLLHAHATKIGLLLINDPFTPSALQRELVSCERLCIPGMVGAVELFHPRVWTISLAKEAKLRVQAAVGAFALLLADVHSKAQGGSVKFDSSKRKEKTLVSTGQVWEACDALVALEKHGLADAVLRRAKEREVMMKDALEELKEWREDEDDQDEGFVAGSDDEREDHGDRDSMEDMFSAGRLPAHRDDIKDLFDGTYKQLKLIHMLFQAIIKRRAKTLVVPEYEDHARMEDRIATVAKVDALLLRMQAIADGVDELAGSFYELNTDLARAQTDALVANACALASSMENTWDGTEDEFTAWSKKWKVMIDKEKPSPKQPIGS